MRTNPTSERRTYHLAGLLPERLEVIESDADHVVASCNYLPDHPVFAGHYPGFPIVPGNFVLGIMEHLASTQLHQEPVRGLVSVRFLKPIFPDQPFEVTVTRGTRSGDHGSTGVGRLGAEKSCVATLLDDPRLSDVSFLQSDLDPEPLGFSLKSILPHREPILLVDRLVRMTGRLVAQKDIHSGEALTGPSGVYPLPLLIESAAQGAIATLVAGTSDLSVKGKVYLFAGVRNVSVLSEVATGSTVTHMSVISKDLGDTIILDTSSWVEDRCVLQIQGMTLALRPAEQLKAGIANG